MRQDFARLLSAHCYAETFAERFRGVEGHPYEMGFDLTLRPERLDIPLRWTKPRMIFVNSMSDLFHEDIPVWFVARVFAAMTLSPQHIFQVLTKRPERMQRLLTGYFDKDGGPWTPRSERYVFPTLVLRAILELAYNGGGPVFARRAAALNYRDFKFPVPWPLPNVWLGTSIENRRFVGRADALRETPAAVRFISAEPLLGPLVFRSGCVGYPGERKPHLATTARRLWPDGYTGTQLDLSGIDWLIAGGESGHGARRIDTAWVEDLLAACESSGTAPFVKQLGTRWAREYRAKNSKGEDPSEWPEHLRVREYPR